MSRSEHVYLALRSEMMSGRVSPWDRLAEERLAENFEVSRTPVREALARLTADGLVEKRDGGYFMYMPAFDQIEDLYELRTTLELQGITRVADRAELQHDHAAIAEELRYWYDLRANRPEPEAGFVSSDEGFHTVILDAAGNQVLTEALVSVNQRIRPVRMYDYLTEDRMTATIEEHIGIAELIIAGQLEEATQALRTHIAASRDIVVERAARSMSITRTTFRSKAVR